LFDNLVFSLFKLQKHFFIRCIKFKLHVIWGSVDHLFCGIFKFLNQCFYFFIVSIDLLLENPFCFVNF
jgi:hypothetical protein